MRGMRENPICLKLVHSQKSRRSQTAVLVFPGLIPMYSNMHDEIKFLAKFGDVLEFHYPESRMDVSRFYRDVTEAIRSLGYKKLLFVGFSFGGTLAYMLMRYWRKHRMKMGVQAFVALSTPFEPENLTPISQFQVDMGVTLDRYARKVFIVAVKIVRWIWRWSFGINSLYTKDNSLKQTLNALWVGGGTLKHDWLVKKKMMQVPAMLLNVRRDRADRIVNRTNEEDFLEIFPKGKILRVLRDHADLNGISKASYQQIEALLRDGLKAGVSQFV
jgi:pimeloyl-ACP methyl ester carboxylesterase